LNVGDFNIDDRVIEVHGTKFFKSRRLPLSGSAVAALQSYLTARKGAGASMSPDAALFWHQHAGGRYSRDRAGRLLVHVLRRAKQTCVDYAACGIAATMPLPGLCREDQNEVVRGPRNQGVLARQPFNMRHSPKARDQSCLRKASNSSSG
jgi:hypothetical protein